MMKSLEDQLPTPEDLEAVRREWELELRAAGTWPEYENGKLGIVEGWLKEKAVERGLERIAWPPDCPIETYIERCIPSLISARDNQ
jgi:hypothetical protein